MTRRRASDLRREMSSESRRLIVHFLDGDSDVLSREIEPRRPRSPSRSVRVRRRRVAGRRDQRALPRRRSQHDADDRRRRGSDRRAGRRRRRRRRRRRLLSDAIAFGGASSSLHQKKSAGRAPRLTLCGDAALEIDRPVTAEQVRGRVIAVERAGRRVDLEVTARFSRSPGRRRRVRASPLASPLARPRLARPAGARPRGGLSPGDPGEVSGNLLLGWPRPEDRRLMVGRETRGTALLVALSFLALTGATMIVLARAEAGAPRGGDAADRRCARRRAPRGRRSRCAARRARGPGPKRHLRIRG